MIHLDKKTKLVCVMVITVIGVYFGFEYILPLFVPFLVAYFIAWVLRPIVGFLNHKLRMPRLIAGILSLGLLGTGAVWLMIYLLTILVEQIVYFLKNIPIYLAVISEKMDSLCDGCDGFLGVQLGSARGLMDTNMDNLLNTVKTVLIPKLTLKSFDYAINVVEVLGVLLIILVSIVLLIKDEAEYNKSFQSMVFYKDIHLVTSKLSQTGIAYLRAQAILMLFIGGICTGGLLILHNKYALLIGIGIGIFDAFPVLGSGLILIPWSIISLLNKNVYDAAILMTLYFCCQVVRQCLEPKLLGNRIGIKPVYTLMSMYIGVRLFGFAGFFLGPLGLVIINTVIKESEVRLKIRQREPDGKPIS